MGRALTIPEQLQVESQDPLFPVEVVDCKLEARTLVVFYDSGAIPNMVREEWVQDAGLHGVPITKTIETAGGGTKKWLSHTYSIPLLKQLGEVLRVIAMGVDKITGELEHVDHHPIASLFLSVDPWKLIRPSGQIDLLLRIGLAEIFPYLKDPELHC